MCKTVKLAKRVFVGSHCGAFGFAFHTKRSGIFSILTEDSLFKIMGQIW